MYQATLDRVRRELYVEHPDWAYRTWLRWLACHPEYRRRMGLLLGRGIEPAGWLPPSIIFGAVARGALDDLGRIDMRRLRAETLSFER
jgi:hypothetical protein